MGLLISLDSITSLTSLCEVLNEHRLYLREAGADMSRLPTFGGDTPLCTEGVWSWDPTRKLVQSASGDFVIVSRE